MKRLKGRKKILFIQLIVLVAVIVVSFTYTAEAQALLQTGTNAIDFSLKDITGNETGLSQYSQKKAIVILFWATWSLKSSEALKRFEDYYKKYKDRGIQVIGINVDKQLITDEDLESIKKLLQELNITFPILLDRGLKTFHSYNVIALPSTVVISEGKITYELPGLPLVGTEDMFDYLLLLAGEQPRKKTKPKYMPSHDVIANTNLARQFAKKNMNIMAYPLFKKAIEKDPKYMLPYVELSKLYELEGKNEEAEMTLRKALSVEPQNVVVMSELGFLLSKTGRKDEAIKILEEAVEKNSYTPSHYYYAYALSVAGQIKDSLNAFEKAISLNPFESEIYLLRAEVYENNKMLKEAEADYRKALELLLNIQ